jgi:hypothetical protein
MNRFAVRLLRTFVLLGAVVLACVAFARADVVEYCPVELASPVQAVSPDELGLQFESDGPRTVSGSLFMLTAGGWYQADFTNVALAQTQVTGDDQGIKFTRNPFRSAPVYISLPGAGVVLYAFIAQAQATGDPTFGWDQRGMVACDPPPTPQVRVAASMRGEAPDELPSPQLSSVILQAQHIAEPAGFTTDCATPFATIKKTSQANSELNVNDLGVRGKFAVYIRVAVNAEGKVDGAWPWISSGYPEYDRAMVQQAERSTYTPARSFCASVRAYHLSRITMNDNRR